MLEDKHVGIEIYMIHERIDLMHYNYSPDADIIVSTYTEWDKLYPKNNQAIDTIVRVEFISNKTSGIKRTETYKWWNGRYLGRKREYIKSNI